MIKFRKNNKSKLNRKGIKSRKIIFVIICMLVLSQIFLTIQSSTSGLKLSELEKLQDDLVMQKQDLKNELVASSSVTELREKASELGFIKVEETMYVKVGEPYAGITR